MRLPDLLRALAATYGLSLSRVHNEWAIGEGVVASAANYFASETRRFPLKYLAPADAANLLPNFLLTYVHADPEGNALIASGPDSMLSKIAADLGHIDVPPPQIEVEVLAVESNSLRDLDTAFEYRTAARQTVVDGDAGQIGVSFRKVAAEAAEVRARVQALAQKGVLRVRAQPRTTVLNGRTANLFVGRQRYIQVYRSQYRGLAGEVQSIPVGVSLDVTPWSGGGEITLEVTPEVTTIDESDPVSHLPVIGVRRTTANVRLRDGETVLISGLRSAQQEQRTHKLPLLGDLSVIGTLFRRFQRLETDTELVLFVTARVI